MRLAALAFLAALLLAPLAAQAAQSPARFAVTLQGTIVDRLTYERTAVEDECTSHKTGNGGRGLAIRSLRPTTIVARAARASGARENTIGGDPTLKVTQRTTVRWALTFRRLG
jgi:hypothetical protein